MEEAAADAQRTYERYFPSFRQRRLADRSERRGVHPQRRLLDEQRSAYRMQLVDSELHEGVG